MSLAATANTGLAKRLIPRLDACVESVQRTEPNSVALQHAVVYAGYLTDVTHGRIAADDPNAAGMLGMVAEFCDLVEREYPAVN
jgi:hypothetical protein